MATLQKFKVLATQCGVARSPSRSPTGSPVIHLRRRKTLRMLLSRTGSGNGSASSRRDNFPSPDRDSPKRGKERVVAGHKLKDLFVSSPPAFQGRRVVAENAGDRGGAPVGIRRGARDREIRQLRPLSATIRQRLLRRAWRPVLVTIPEASQK